MDDDRTRGWLMARVELAVAVIAVLIYPVWLTADPNMYAPMFGTRAYPMAFDVLLPIVGEIVMLLALVWMIRIWRGPTREAPPVWRYRDGE